MTAYPCTGPIERGFLEQAIVAQMEKRRLERVRATLRAERVRAAVLYFDRQQEDDVAGCLCDVQRKLRRRAAYLTRCAAGCRWAIAKWEQLQKMLAADGTWYGADRLAAIQLQGVSACLGELYFPKRPSGPGSTAWWRSPTPNKKISIRSLIRRACPSCFGIAMSAALAGKPGREPARLQALVDRELPRLRALEETLRVQYEEPARAAAQDMALAQSPGRGVAPPRRTDARAVVCSGRDSTAEGPQAGRGGAGADGGVGAR